MTVQEVIRLASNAELKQLSIKSDNDAIIGFINLGVLELYKRFPLKEGEAVITLRTGMNTYTISPTSPQVSMYEDSKLLLIVAAYDEEGDELTINDDEDLIQGITTPSYNRVTVPYVREGEHISIVYREAPVFVENLEDEVDIPPQLLEALLNYIGYRGHGAVNGSLNTENNSHYTRFDSSCSRAQRAGLIQSAPLINRKFKDRGFV